MKTPFAEERARYARVLLLIALTLANIGLQLTSAALIKIASVLPPAQSLVISGLLLFVLVLNIGRFSIWGLLHKSYPISITYPASALFFPCVVLLASFYGEPINGQQFVGVAMVTFGVFGLMLEASFSTVGPPIPKSRGWWQ